MKRIINEGGEATNARLTDEMIAKANAFIDGNISNEDAERTCAVYGDKCLNFAIFCRTPRDYQCFKFQITDDDDIKYIGHEGNWRE